MLSYFDAVSQYIFAQVGDVAMTAFGGPGAQMAGRKGGAEKTRALRRNAVHFGAGEQGGAPARLLKTYLKEPLAMPSEPETPSPALQSGTPPFSLCAMWSLAGVRTRHRAVALRALWL